MKCGEKGEGGREGVSHVVYTCTCTCTGLRIFFSGVTVIMYIHVQGMVGSGERGGLG